MTKEELLVIIKENALKDEILGEYWIDEGLYNIGVAYKQLSNSDKQRFGWADLNESVGLPFKNGNSYRAWINRRLIKLELENYPLPIDDEEISLKEKTEKTKINFDADHYKKVVELRDYWTAIRAEKREEARIDSLKNIIINLSSTLGKLPTIKTIFPKVTKNKEAVLLFSDLHIGVLYSSEHNTYNDEVAAARLSKLASDTIKYCKENKITKLNVLNLGDMIQGIIHTNARMYVQYDAITQTMKAAELIANFLNVIQSAAPEITYRSCVDNHSRMFVNKNENIENENLYRIIDWFVEERLKNTDIKFINDNIDISLGRFNLLNGKKVMFAHGHQDNDNQIFQHFIGASKEFIDYAFVSHMHSSKLKDYQNMTIIVNGSIVGTEQYANSIRAYSYPSQTLIVFDGNNLVINKIDLR